MRWLACKRERHVLLDQQDGDAFLVQHLDDLADLRDHARHQPFGRLVEQNDLRLQHHGAGDRQHLLLAAGQRAARLVAPLGEPRKISERLVEQMLAPRIVDAGAVEAGAQVLHHREQAEDAAVLRHVADAEPRQAMRRQAGDGGAVEENAALARLHQAHDRLQGRALADAVAAEQADHLAGPDLERDAVQDVALAVIGVQVLDADQRLRAYVDGGAHVLR